MKHCIRCKEDKPLSDFWIARGAKDGRFAYCKACGSEASRAWRSGNPDTYKRSRRSTALHRQYGLTLDECKQLLASQDGRCANRGCAAPLTFDTKDKRLIPHVDHSHVTGEVRGLLCLTCNTGIGMLGDSVEILEGAKQYLLQSVGQSERLSEKAPANKQDDAIVRSASNQKMQRAAEMTVPVH